MSLIPLRWPAKDPDSVVKRGIDWGPFLDTGATVNSCQWITGSAGTMVIDGQVDTGSGSTITISAGAAGNYYFTCRLFASNGEQEDQVVAIDVRER